MSVTNPCVLDIETSVIPDIAKYADEISKPPSRMKDPEKIAAWIENAKSKQANFAALDMDLARVVCVCWTTDGKKFRGGVAKNEVEERALLEKFWKTSREQRYTTYVGFNILDFDLPLLQRRSQYLNVPYPDLSLGRYRHDGIVDLMQILTWDGKVPYRRLEFYCRRFGIVCPIDDKHDGADVPNLVLLGDYDSVKRHCAADVKKEWMLAERIGVIDQPSIEIADPNQAF